MSKSNTTLSNFFVRNRQVFTLHRLKVLSVQILELYIAVFALDRFHCIFLLAGCVYYSNIYCNIISLNFRKNLTLIILKLNQEGELYKLEQRWWYDKGECGAAESKVLPNIYIIYTSRDILIRLRECTI
jgi:hypothetical protein